MVRPHTVGIVVGALGAVGAVLFLARQTIAEAIRAITTRIPSKGFYVTPTTWSEAGWNQFRLYYNGEPLRNVAIFAHSMVFKNLLVRTNADGYGTVETIIVAPPLVSTGDIMFEVDPIITGLARPLYFTVAYRP